MKKCPIKRKTSDLAASNGQQNLRNRGNWGSLAGLAKIQGCSERTVREWCKQGLIKEAYQTPGGHWRIQKPLSWRTLVFLAKRLGEWPFKNTADDGPLADDYQWAEWLLLAQLYQHGLLEELPVPTLADADDVIAQPGDETAKKARQIQEEIIRRLKKKEPFWDLLLIGWMYQWVYQSSQEDRGWPMVSRFAKFMGLTRAAFYRRYPTGRKAIKWAYYLVNYDAKPEPPDPDGLDSVQRANRGVKKSNFESIQKVYAPKGDLRISRRRKPLK